jgi:hypothetical protein
VRKGLRKRAVPRKVPVEEEDDAELYAPPPAPVNRKRPSARNALPEEEDDDDLYAAPPMATKTKSRPVQHVSGQGRKDREAGKGLLLFVFFLFNCVVCCSVNSCGELRNPSLLPKDETPCICCRGMVLTGACRNGMAPLSMPHFVNTYLRFRAGRRGALNPTHHTNAMMPEQKLLEENCVACPLDPSKSPKIPLQKRSRPREHVYMQLLNPPRLGLWSGQNSSGTLPFYG